jgi:hypothetical protein
MAKFPLRTIRNSGFFSLYRKLIDRNELSNEEKTALLAIAVMLLNEPEEHSVLLGYRIIVMYSNHTSDLKPLYDVSLSRGYPLPRCARPSRLCHSWVRLGAAGSGTQAFTGLAWGKLEFVADGLERHDSNQF